MRKLQLDRSASEGQDAKSWNTSFLEDNSKNNGDSAHTTPAGLVRLENGLRPVSCYFDVCEKI